MISFKDALDAEPPQVWLNGAFGFDPEDWGGLTFTDKTRLETIRKESKSGFLTIVYGATTQSTPPKLRSKILGVYQCSHETDDSGKFLSPIARQRKQRIQYSENSWGHAFRIIRAWRTIPESAPTVSDFAHLTYSPAKGRSISRYSARLTHEEAVKILDVDLNPTYVFGGDNDFEPGLTTGLGIISPSKAGPVSQSPFVSRESEGPKHLYVLKLHGPLDSIFDEPLEGQSVVKVGFSRSPMTRCEHFNKALPTCLLRWQILHSTHDEGDDPLPDSTAARCGEDVMKLILDQEGKSLGGEFFLATAEQIEGAWNRAKLAARDHSEEPK